MSQYHTKKIKMCSSFIVFQWSIWFEAGYDLYFSENFYARNNSVKRMRRDKTI